MEILALVLWGYQGNYPPRTVVGLNQNHVRDLRLLVCVRVLGLAETLGLETFGCLTPRHLH